MRAGLVAIVAGISCASANAGLVVINFDNLPSGTTVTNQYPEATFSAGSGGNTAFSFGSAHSAPNIICTPSCIVDTYVDFTNPVKNLTFWAIEANAAGHTADFNVFVNGSFAATVPFISSGGAPHNEFVDLSAFTNVTRLEIVNILNNPTTENGIGWDTFSFEVIPAPGSLALLAIGGLAAVRRR